MERVPPHVLAHLSSFLCTRDALRSRANASLREALETEPVFRMICVRDLAMDPRQPPVPPPSAAGGELPGSFRDAWFSWRASLSRYPYGLVCRMHRVWLRIDAFFRASLPAAADSLLPGLSEEGLRQLEASAVGAGLPPLLRLMLRFKGGQRLVASDIIRSRARSISPTLRSEAVRSFGLGLFGGLMFYSTLQVTQLVPHELIVHLPAHGAFVFADDIRFPGSNQIAVTPENDVVAVGDQGARFPCHPPTSHGDGLLMWLEEYSHRLDAGVYAVAPADLGSDTIDMLWRFPLPAAEAAAEHPACASAEVTQGLRVSASPVLVLQNSSDTALFFTYQLRMRLLPSSPHERAQLSLRHWDITHHRGGQTEVVEGPGVVGEHPVLVRGDSGPPFHYASCTRAGRAGGTMGGWLSFVPGTLAAARGEEFHAAVPTMALALPEWIF